MNGGVMRVSSGRRTDKYDDDERDHRGFAISFRMRGVNFAAGTGAVDSSRVAGTVKLWR